ELTLRDDAKVVRVLARDNVEVDDGWLCDKGRFGYQSFRAEERITGPMVRDGGFMREVSWERALSEAAAALKKSGERTVALVGGGATNEEGFLVQHLMREGLGAEQVTSRSAGPLSGVHARVLARPDLSAQVSDIDHAGAILVLDTELVDEAPILDLRVRKAVRRNGARLVVASSRPSTLDPNASAALRFSPGAAEAALAALAAALGSSRAASLSPDDLARKARASEGFRAGAQPTARSGNGADPSASAVRAAADVLRGAGDVVVIWGERVASGQRGGQAIEALLALAGALGVAAREESGMIEIPAAANGRGLREVGCVPNLGPGLAESAAETGGSDEVGALLLVDQSVPATALEEAGTVIAFAGFLDKGLEEQADIVFPAETYAEKEGTVTHPDGRLQRVRQALGHAAEVRSCWRVIEDLCERLGAGTGALTAPMVTAQMTVAVPFYGGITLDEIGGLGVRWPEREAATALGSEELPTEALADPPAATDTLHVTSAPTLWSGPEIRHSPSLHFLSSRARAEISVEDARRAGVANGDEMRLTAHGQTAEAVAAVRTGVPAGSVFLIGATLPDGAVELSPARTRSEIPA
ncbi:MAG TPA: molybdopterin-dependent oxidoreductase, partial [Thermoleophilaceae bacterium]|nr:molybdopterin-dependent oxidoreductase [Thermoleophilaceae bacterium]